MCMVLIIIATTSKERGHITLYTWNVLSFHFFFWNLPKFDSCFGSVYLDINVDVIRIQATMSFIHINIGGYIYILDRSVCWSERGAISYAFQDAFDRFALHTLNNGSRQYGLHYNNNKTNAWWQCQFWIFHYPCDCFQRKGHHFDFIWLFHVLGTSIDNISSHPNGVWLKYVSYDPQGTNSA